MIVIDASVLADALVDDGPEGNAARSVLGQDPHWAAPEHLLVEVFSVIRGKTLGGKLDAKRAEEAIDALCELQIDQTETSELLPRMWQRHNTSGYDAAYVAAAEILGCPLITGDGRLARAEGLCCEVHVIGPDD